MGAKGAVIGSLSAEMAITILYLWNCKGYMTLRQIVSNGWRKCLAAIVMFVLVRYTATTISNETVAVLLSIFVGASIYCIRLLILKDQFATGIVMFFLNRIRNRE